VSDSDEVLLSVTDLKQYFQIKRSVVKAVDGVSFSIRRGEIYGLVGESSSGKTTTGRSVIRLYKPTAGKIIFNGADISGAMPKDREQALRTKMGIIFQDPMSSLNPRMKVMDIIAAGLDYHKMYAGRRDRERKVYEMLERVGLSSEHANRYPHQFSGGQRQRIGIARALIMRPELIIADEPISALDVSIQAQVVNLLKDIRDEYGTAFLFIAHDLSMVRYVSDNIGVMHRGHMVESGKTNEVFYAPCHPYTKSLLSAIPYPNPILEKKRTNKDYDYKTSGIDYTKGVQRDITLTHKLLATENEFRTWRNT
jgi:oligopeptide transport system ATP-binding protein